jgi:hypothetical protein
MIDEKIESRPASMTPTLIPWLVALILTVLGLAWTNPHALCIGVLLFAVGLALLLGRERPFRLELTEDGLEVGEPATSVPYSKIETILSRRRSADPDRPGRGSFAFDILHRAGIVKVPARLSVSSEDLFQFLFAQFTASGSRKINPLLLGYLQTQVEKFGKEKVLSYRARRYARASTMTARMHWLHAAVLLTCVAWIVIGNAWNDAGGWAIAGFWIFPWAGFIWLFRTLAARRSGRGIQKLRESSLVVSPSGIAMVQGDLRGEMRWRELRKVHFVPTARFAFSAEGQSAGVYLVFVGATARIADIYDRPLFIIHEQIMRYWQPKAIATH